VQKLILILLFIPLVSFGQDYGNDSDALKLCTAFQTNSFISDSKADNALDRILSVIGASKRFVLQPCDNINNAVATSYKGIRYILYDKDFMDSLDSGDNWNNLFILAHEVGHHINGHSLDLLLYATEAVEPETLANKRNQELEADEFAGFILGKLGATLEQTSSIIKLLSSEKDDTYDTHPSKSKRLASISLGYNKALGNETVVYTTPTNPQTAEEYFYSAYNKEKAGDNYKAIEDYNKAIEIDPNYALAYTNRGFSKHNLKDFNGAIEDHDKAIELDPEIINVYVNRGASKSELKDYYGAIEDFNKAIELDPSYDKAYLNRGFSKSELKDYYGAIEDFNKAIELNSNYTKAYYNRGISKYYLNDFNGAIEDHDKAIELDPNFALSYSNRATSKFMLKDYYGAIADFTKVIEIDPNNADVYYNRGISKSRLRDYSGTCQDARKAQSLGYDASKLIKLVCN
jgi:tetratricopeptide (TPR) repeat protein